MKSGREGTANRCVGLILAAIALLATCNASFPIIGGATVPSPTSPIALLRDEDAGRRVMLEGGQILELSLEGNPSTGYVWEPRGIDDQVLHQIGTSQFAPESELLGAPGRTTWRFAPSGVGNKDLVMV